jgi:hypothetical protein
MTTDTQKIVEKLDIIQSELAELRKSIVDVDLVLSDDDLESMNEAESDLKAGKTKRL